MDHQNFLVDHWLVTAALDSCSLLIHLQCELMWFVSVPRVTSVCLTYAEDAVRKGLLKRQQIVLVSMALILRAAGYIFREGHVKSNWDHWFGLWSTGSSLFLVCVSGFIPFLIFQQRADQLPDISVGMSINVVLILFSL